MQLLVAISDRLHIGRVADICRCRNRRVESAGRARIANGRKRDAYEAILENLTGEFLASDRASAITGVILVVVDAGWDIASTWAQFGGVRAAPRR